MAFILRSGAAKVEWFPKKASTVMANNCVVGFSVGEIFPANTTTTRIAGVLQKAIAATDTDYASETRVPVLVPGPDAVFEADVTTGTAVVTANLGVAYDLDSTTGLGVNLNGTSHKQVTVVGFISSTKVLVKFNSAYMFVNAV